MSALGVQQAEAAEHQQQQDGVPVGNGVGGIPCWQRLVERSIGRGALHASPCVSQDKGSCRVGVCSLAVIPHLLTAAGVVHPRDSSFCETDLVDAENAAAAAALQLFHARQNLARKSEKTLGIVRLLAGQNHGMTGISALANRRIELDASEERHVELLRRALAAAGGEDIDLVIAVRADEVAHVLDDAEDFDAHLA